ncbi:MAG: fumarylacetoacetase [Acidimicrobiales bacterium]
MSELVVVDLSNGVPVPDGSSFTLANLPFGVSGGRVHVAIGDHAVDVAAAAGFGLLDVDPTVVEGCRLDGLLAAGPSTWGGLREEVGQVLADEPGRLAKTMVDRATLAMELPVTVGDYVDGYAGLHHATNLGRILRPDGEPLQPNWRHLPVAYHGRSGTIVVGGGEIGRPSGQVLVDGAPVLAPSAQLDIELELGAIVGVANAPGEPIPVGEADTHLFGFVLVNDWSARDIQAWEYQPLGPFLGKSFATSVSPWVVTVDALAPHRVVGLAGEQDPPPLSYLRGDPAVPDLHLTVDLTSAQMRDEGGEPFRVGEVDLAPSLYWTPAQQLAHCTVNGATVRPGDLLASGTISGPDHTTQAGSLIERTWRGAEPFTLPTGEERSFLADGDQVVLDGWAGDGADRVGFGPLSGTIAAAR